MLETHPDGKAHPLADAFPLLKGEEFKALKQDIREHGLRAPVIVDEFGRILDGRNRYRACKQLSDERDGKPLHHWLKTKPVTLSADEQVEMILSLNVHRRHLTTSQRAMVAARLAEGGNFAGPFQKDRAFVMSVSERTLRDAEAVLKRGDDELIAAVDDGSVSVSDAAKRLKPPKTKPKPEPAAVESPASFTDRIVDGPAEPEPSPSSDGFILGAPMPVPWSRPEYVPPTPASPPPSSVEVEDGPTDWSAIARRLDVSQSIRNETLGLPHRDVLLVVLHALSEAGLTDEETTLVLSSVKASNPDVAKAWARHTATGLTE